MGTIPICSKVLEIENKKIEVNVWTATSDLSLEDKGAITIDWMIEGVLFLAHIPNRIFSDLYMEHFFLALEEAEGFARRFEVKKSTIKKQTEKVNIQDITIEIDIEIAKVIKILNERGFKTQNCCRGIFFEDEEHSFCAYLTAESLPGELVDVAREAGFFATQKEIRADFPPEFRLSANRNFCRILNDWANNINLNAINYMPTEDVGRSY